MIVWVKKGIFAPVENRAIVLVIKPNGLVVQSCGRPDECKIVALDDVVAIEVADIASNQVTYRVSSNQPPRTTVQE